MHSIGLCAQVACIAEATARKPGNVHRFLDFDDVGLIDFLLSAAAVAPVLEVACRRSVGETILEAVQATRRVVATNTNLGILLLLTPLAAVPADRDLRAGVKEVLDRISVDDARQAYQAIRLAVPAGLGKVAEQDIHEEPTQTLRQVMELAADRDLIARQYANGFQQVFDEGVPVLAAATGTLALEEAIILCHLHLMSRHPDNLIVRKRGLAEADEAGRRARRVLDNGWPHQQRAEVLLRELDAWLRAEGHGRNPGTTADLVTACLFVALRQGTIQMPFQFLRARNAKQ
jgi:triphosphoribosyl-dephospho-CoA synthase